MSTGFIALALVVVALVLSVLIPARQTWLITKLLRETTEVLSPARLLQAELQSGLAEEIGALQSYALSGDTTFLARYGVMSARDDKRLAALDAVAGRFGAHSAAHLDTVRQRIETWRRTAGASIAQRAARDDVAAAFRNGRGDYYAFQVAIADLSADFAAEASARDDRVQSLEHLGLIWNAAMVLAAFVALCAVVMLTVRERRLAASLRRRVKQESMRARQELALREFAEALAGAFTIDDVTQRIADAALATVGGRGAFVEWISMQPDEPASVSVRAVAGAGVPPLSSVCEYAGSYTEQVAVNPKPALIPNLGQADSSARTTLSGPQGPAIVVPLRSGGKPLGALFVLSSRDHFRADDVARAAIFSHLAALAYEKVRLLDEAIQGRRRLERVITSRSRLMRGFSHDVKNPIGAADGYAELLSDGVYGDLNARQQESVTRLRRCVREALDLIDDLHELARAETGHLALSPDPVDVAELVCGAVEEYQASAASRRLSLTVEIADDLPMLTTSRTRVRQILANLLSNALKYADAGSVAVSAGRASTGPFGAGGDWVYIQVRDTGRGIPADKLDFIFEEFGRIGDSDQTGAGLGLAISRLLAQALGGQISVASRIGVGSTFSLWLPLTSQEVLETAAAVHEGSG
ncbi:MAG TPA: ATP-binding protein [Gemmatimonadaceae bacterium]|nr:ATP-binding protein [Gemmatimonadaceae bacterium]